MTIGERIKKLRLRCNLSQEELAKKLGTTKQCIYKYETGIVTNIPSSKIQAIADLAGVSPSWIMGWEDEKNAPNITSDFVTYPVIGDIAAGYNAPAIEDWSGATVDIPLSYLRGHDKNEFIVLEVHGDSMYPLYMDGDKVLVLRQGSLNHSGEIGAVIYDGEFATLKKVEYVEREDWIRLVPINPNFPPKLIKGSDLEACRILGIPKLIIREITE